MSPTVPNALYTDADGTISLVVLDETDRLLETVRGPLAEDAVEAILAGETSYRVAGMAVEVGDGDTFRRVEVR